MALNKYIERFDSDTKDLIRGSGATFIIRIVGVFLLYIFTAIITNTLGANVYGEFAFFILSLKLISLLTTAGIDTYLLRYISSDPEEKKIGKLVGEGTIAVIFNTLIVCVIFYFLAQYYYQTFFSDYWYITLLLIGVFPFSISKLNAQAYRAKKKATMFSIIEFTGIPFFSIIFFFLLKKLNLENNITPVYAYLLGIITIFFISTLKWQFKYGPDIIKNLGQHIKGISKTNKLAMPFLIAGSAIYFGQWGVSLILKYFEGNDALGNFDAAFRIGYLLMLPLFASATISAPIFSRKYADKDQQGLKQILKLTTNAVFVLTVPMMIVAYVFSDQIMALYGPDFVDSGNILKIILIGFFFNALTGPISVMLQMAEKQVLVQNVFLICTVFNVIISYYLIPKYGIIGACWSNVIYQIVLNGYLLVYLKLKFGYLSFGR